MTSQNLPLGKLPHTLLSKLLNIAPISDPRVIIGPGIGLDCAIIDIGKSLLVLKSDPITFATDMIGWYAVQVNANDIVTTGAIPRWFLMTLLLPEKDTHPNLVDDIFDQVYKACQDLSISVVGGHTEITFDLNRPIIIGTLLGEVLEDQLITPRGVSPGDIVLLTKGVPIEATAILAREFSIRLSNHLSPKEIQQAQDFLYTPGISVVKDARIATQSGPVTAMHDPTEGGLISALWELAEASNHAIIIDPQNIYIPKISQKICDIFGLDPLRSIASGALLLTVKSEYAHLITQSLENNGISCCEIGKVEAGESCVWEKNERGLKIMPRPIRDEIAVFFETHPE